MDIHTTINIEIEILEKIKNASELLKISTNEIISMLLIKIAKTQDLQSKMFYTVKYQERRPKCLWKKLHINFVPAVYETGLDLRKVLKKSVSFIISLAITDLLDELIEEIKNKKTDNYTRNYVFFNEYIDNVHSFTIFLGVPRLEYLEKYLQE